MVLKEKSKKVGGRGQARGWRKGKERGRGKGWRSKGEEKRRGKGWEIGKDVRTEEVIGHMQSGLAHRMTNWGAQCCLKLVY